MNILEVKNVGKTYASGTKALSNISFDIKEGEFITIIGPSGAGKSTLLRCINRLIDVTEGDILFDGDNITQLNKKELRALRTKIGMIFQHYNLVDRLSVIENVLHGRLGYKSTINGMIGNYSEKEKILAFVMLDKLGLTEQAYKRSDELSGGQKQRVGIARAIVQEPKLILCDEPIASLDPNASKIIMDHLKNINTEMKITCLLNLHQVDVALKYSDRIIGISGGNLVFDGKPEDLTQDIIHMIYKSETGDLITDLEKQTI